MIEKKLGPKIIRIKSDATDFNIYRNELDKGCFQHDMAYENQKFNKFNKNNSIRQNFKR